MTLSVAIAITLATLSGLIYVRSAIRKETRPSIPATVVFILSLATALASGESLGGSLALMPGLVNLIALVAIVVIAAVQRTGHFAFAIPDRIGLCIVLLSLVLWYLTDSPFVALVAATAVDAVGIILVLVKLTKDPNSESLVAWALIALAYAAPMVTAEVLSASNTLYSVVCASLCGAVALLTVRQRMNRRLI